MIISNNSLNLFNLINFADSKISKILNHNGKIEIIENKNKEFVKNLEKHRKFKEVIKGYRDKSGAHIDKKLANRNKRMRIELDRKEFREIINKIDIILSFYWEEIVGKKRSLPLIGEDEAAEQMKKIIKMV